MPKTHLPAHMDSVREKCRPKHQLLILKCYPRLPKNSSADVRPNGSELSYLLYYASTRSSKLQKVGAFLEKKTTADVARFQSARVMVTLQILQALVEKVVGVPGSALALITPSVLRVIREVLLHTTDISLIEATLPTWEAFCKHRDYAAFSADQEYRALYEQVVGLYAGFARKDGSKKLGKSTQPVATHDAIRLRDVGLGAIKSVVLSSTVAFESSGQLLDVMVPAILTNLHAEDGQYLDHLVVLNKKNEEEEKDKAMNRRQSMATVRTRTSFTENSVDADPRAAEGTVQDADRLAEEETALLALECLETVFNTENRTQIRAATSAILGFLSAGITRQRPATNASEKALPVVAPDSWAHKVFELSTEWTPVQDRFVVLVTLVESLIRLPLSDLDLRHQLLYSGLIDHILRSGLNLIGLSVMDVLLGLIQQTLNVLQLSGTPVAATPSSRGQSKDEELKRIASTGSRNELSVSRLRLVVRLKECIADLATHVYYTDQITDMISAILLRLKPNVSPSGQTSQTATAAAIEEPKATAEEMKASMVSLQSRDRSLPSNGYFSFDIARQMALEAVKDIIKVANSSRAYSTEGVADSRNPIPISIWEGTQWLLRDPSAGVRRAYVDSISTWLENETKKSDARISVPKTKTKRPQTQDGTNEKLARRAVSNASVKGRQKKVEENDTSTFLQLLHLAVYENALQYASSSEGDIVGLHLLLTSLVRKLGVNALKDGLPMIMALQEDIAKTELPISKVRIGALVHGYLWTIVEVFDFQTDTIGQEVFAEIARRKQHKLWVKDITYPPMPISKIPNAPAENPMDANFVASEELKPFDHRQELVNSIAKSYEVKILTPTPSAPSSPGRSYVLPRSTTNTERKRASSFLAQPSEGRLMESAGSNYFPDRSIAPRVKEGMMASWSREACLAAVATAAPKSVSLSGSRSSPTQALAAGNHRSLLVAASAGATPPRNSSPSSIAKGQAGNYRQQAFGSMNPRLHSPSPNRRPSASTNGRGDSSSAGAKAPLRIDELKRILANGGTTGALTTGIIARHDPADDTASDSMVETEADFGSDDGHYDSPSHIPGAYKTDGSSNAEANTRRPLTMSSSVGRDTRKVSTKKNLGALLAGINVDSDVGVVSQVGMARPPY